MPRDPSAGRDLAQLAADRETDAGLQQSGTKTVEALAADLAAAHAYLIDPVRSGLLGYLYRKQIQRYRESVNAPRK